MGHPPGSDFLGGAMNSGGATSGELFQGGIQAVKAGNASMGMGIVSYGWLIIKTTLNALGGC